MKRWFLGLFAVISITSNAMPTPFSLPGVAQEILNTTFTELTSQGVLRLDPYDSRLPYPQIRAIEALLNPKTGAFCYYDQETVGNGITYVFKDRQGGNRHRISFNEAHIQLVTPYLGTIAHANRFKVEGGWRYRFYCQSEVVSPEQWDYCIRNLFIGVIRQQMLGF